MKTAALIPFLILVPTASPAQDEPVPCEPAKPCENACDGTCLSDEDKKAVVESIEELKAIKEAEAKIEVQDEVVIVRDWDGRVYINGGETKPIRLKLTVGTVERDMEMVVPTRVYYRPEPPEPMFRLRIRAQAGVLATPIIRSLQDDEYEAFLDGGVGWDFFHLDWFNFSVYTGVRSVGLAPGMDLTKNFGVYAGPVLVYEGLEFTGTAGAYFSFN